MKGAVIVLASGGMMMLAGCQDTSLITPTPMPLTPIPTYQDDALGHEGRPTYDDPDFEDPDYETGPAYDEPGFVDPEYDDPSYEIGPTYDNSNLDDDADTNPCAFPGDPLCPHTPLTVPGPLLPKW